MSKAPPKTVAFKDVAFVPRFEYGEMCTIGAVCGSAEGTVLGTGFARMTKAHIPWTVKYDEVLTVIEGALKVHAGGKVHKLGPCDSMWIPNGTALIYEAESALVHYAIHPANFADAHHPPSAK